MNKRITLLFLSLCLSLGVFGGISAQDAPQIVTFRAPRLIVNTSFLNVRTGPGTQFSVLTTVVGGTELPVLGVAGDGIWYQVNTNGGVGWVNVEFTIPRGFFANVPLVDAPLFDPFTLSVNGQGGESAQPTQISTSTGNRVTGYTLVGRDLRAEPSFTSLLLARNVPSTPNTIYPLLDARTVNGTTWYLVNVPNVGTGWTDAVELRLLECGPDAVFVLTREAPIRFDGISTRESFNLPVGTEGFVVGVAGAGEEFFRFELLNGTIGLVNRADVVRRTGVQNICTGIAAPATVATDGQGGGVVAPAVPTGNRVIVNTAFLNVRSGPSVQSSSLGVVSGGTTLAVVGRAPDGVWYLVDTAFGQGWINIQFAIFRGNINSVQITTSSNTVASTGQAPIQTGPGGTGLQSVTDQPASFSGTNSGQPNTTFVQPTGNRLIVNTAFLNVRSGPSASFSRVATVPGGTILAVLGRAPDGVWHLVEGMFGTGWINIEFAIFRGNYSAVPLVNETDIVATLGQGGGVAASSTQSTPGAPLLSAARRFTGVTLEGKNIHAGPTYDSLVLTSAPPIIRDTVYPLLDQTSTQGRTWYLVNYGDFGTGWVDGVQFRALECSGFEAIVVTRRAPIRFDGIANRESFLLDVGAEGYLVGRQSGFAVVELLDGTVGLLADADFVLRPDSVRSFCDGIPSVPVNQNLANGTTNNTANNDQITVIPVPTFDNRVIINTAFLNVRSGPGGEFSRVTTVAGGETYAVEGRSADGNWLYIQGGFGFGWVDISFVIFRGEYATVPVLNLTGA